MLGLGVEVGARLVRDGVGPLGLGLELGMGQGMGLVWGCD